MTAIFNSFSCKFIAVKIISFKTKKNGIFFNISSVKNIPSNYYENITYILVNDSSNALSVISKNFYDFPSQKLEIVGVTGTNGKTSIVSLLHQLFSIRGYKCGLISTIENLIDQQKYISTCLLYTSDAADEP